MRRVHTCVPTTYVLSENKKNIDFVLGFFHITIIISTALKNHYILHMHGCVMHRKQVDFVCCFFCCCFFHIKIIISTAFKNHYILHMHVS